MQFTTRVSTGIFCFLMGLSVFSTCFAYQNPFLFRGENKPDKRLGSFSQNNTGDCFFLASLIAIAQDSDGQELIESAFQHDTHNGLWQISFPNLLDHPVEITAQEAKEYKLTDSSGYGVSSPVWGDPDIKLLEIAADKIWRKTVKASGLWDDVPMNAIFMFSNKKQLLIWNKSKATQLQIQDISKYYRIPESVIKDINVSSIAAIKNLLKTILFSDKDGISMVLIDYVNYHAVAITQMSFVNNTYSYIDTSLKIHDKQSLEGLLLGLFNGQYAINYLEIQ
ncbi:MAG: hypothetical protein L3J75_00130 [Methylococcaceae bacterium]|nr:hypothetical protein [Methylococcaceae bacterium]